MNGVGTGREPVRVWAAQRRGRDVGDPLGQLVHDILWRPVGAGDHKAARSRIEDLAEVFTSLSPERADALRERLSSGDLAPDFEYRLAGEARFVILEKMEADAEAGKSRRRERGISHPSAEVRERRQRESETPGSRATDPPARGVAEGRRAAEAPRAALQAAVGRSFEIVEKQVFSRKVGALFVFVTVRGTVELAVLSQDEGTVRAYLDLTGGGTSGSIDVADALFGADASISVSKDSYAFGIGRNGFALQLSNSMTSPVSLSLPSVRLANVQLESVAPRLGIKGRGEFALDLIVDVVPDYRQLSRLVRTGGATLKSIIRRGAGVISSGAVRITRGVGKIIATGRRAIDRMLMQRLERIALNILARYTMDLLKRGSKATMTAAAQRWASSTARWASRSLGAVGIWYQSQVSVERAGDEILRAIIRRRTERILASFRFGFSHMLFQDLCRPSWRRTMAGYAENPIVAGFASPFPPNEDRWRIRRGEEGPLMRWLEGPGQGAGEKKLMLLEADWREMIRGAIRGSVHAELRLGGLDSRIPVLEASELEARAAGRAAAYQAVWGFIIGLSDPSGRDTWPLSGPEQWDAVASMYRSVFTASSLENIKAIGALVDFDEIRLPPFGS